MTTAARYIHGTAPDEQVRLANLNRLTNAAFVEFLAVEPDSRVLEVGSGLGILAAEVAAAAEGIQVLGVEYSPEQLAAAVEAPRVRLVHGDAHALEFSDESFDLVYARYLLEHVADPVRVLSEMRRVTRRSGRVAVMENDISLVRLDPPCPAADAAWTAFIEYQSRLGGDGLIGRRLFRLFRAVGFESIELSVQPEIHWSGSPGFVAWVENLIGNIEGAREGLIQSGLSCEADVHQSTQEMRGLLERDDASATFVWNRAIASR